MILIFGVEENSGLLFSVSKTPNHKLIAWEYDKGKIKSVCDFFGFYKINGLLFSSTDKSFLFAFGNPINGFPIKCFWLRNEHETLSITAKNDLIKDFLKAYNKNFTTACGLFDSSIVRAVH